MADQATVGEWVGGWGSGFQGFKVEGYSVTNGLAWLAQCHVAIWFRRFLVFKVGGPPTLQ